MICATNLLKRNGAMAELVDALVLGTNFFGSEGSSPFRPTKNDYADNYDMSVLSTEKKKKGVVLNKNFGFGSLRKNHTFHLNKECCLNCLVTTPFFNINLKTHVCRSCRQSIGLSSRRSQVFCKLMEMFSLCPQKLKRHYYKHN